jgi:hypothetical protein
MGGAQVVEYLPSKTEALSPNPRTEKKREKGILKYITSDFL